MSSEAIVVLVLIALAIGFIIWVRKNSHDHDRADQAGNFSDDGRNTRDRK